MRKERTPWTQGAVLICTKCHKSLLPADQPNEGNCGEILKNELKENLKKSGYGKELRVMNVGCLGVCIPELQAVSYLPHVDSGQQTETMTIKPSTEKNEFFNWVKAKIR